MHFLGLAFFYSGDVFGTGLLNTVKFLGVKGELKIAQWIRGSHAAWTELHDKASSTSYGSFNGHSETWWRGFIKLCYCLGYVERELQSLIKKSSTYAIQAVYHVTSKGEELISTEERCLVPSWLVNEDLKTNSQLAKPLAVTDASETSTLSNSTKTRVGKGTPPLLIVRKLMNEKENWKDVSCKKDYQYPGVFSTAQMQCVFYTADYTTLQQSSSHDKHFMWNDVQLSKGKLNKDRLIDMFVGSTKEMLHYRSAPCAGIKRCSDPLCDYVVSVREKRQCPSHPTIPLKHCSGCPVEIAYMYPKDICDNRRWMVGLVRHQKEPTTNLHSHPIHGPVKIAKCIKESISEAVSRNATLTPVDISHGKGLEFVPDQGSTHIGRIRQEVKRTKSATNERIWNCMQLEELLDEIDLEESKMINDSAEEKEVSSLARPYLLSAGIDNGIKYIHTMNPLMIQLLSEAEFLQTDITYNVTTDYPYLFNAVVFNYDTLEWAIVGRVHLSHQTSAAYALAFSKLFTKCKNRYPNFELGKSLVGVITDWSDAEVNGLKKFAGDKVATQLLKGCRVHWIRSWHRVRDKNIGNAPKESKYLLK